MRGRCVCTAMQCDRARFRIGGGYSEVIVCRAWQWCVESNKATDKRGEGCRNI